MMEACVCDIDVWMTVNMLKMNRDKTELLVLNGRQRPLPPLTTISVCDEEINQSTKARNVGVIYDLSMSMESHNYYGYLQGSILPSSEYQSH